MTPSPMLRLRLPLRQALATLALAWPLAGIAGRPLATEDAAVEAHGVCHLEAWVDHNDAERARTISPACGLFDALEVAWGHQSNHPKDELGRMQEFAVKWLAPELSNTLHWGAKLAHTATRIRGMPTERANMWLLMASWQAHHAWTVHANVGTLHELQVDPALGRRRANQAALAVTYAPSERWLVFAESLAEAGTHPTLGLGTRYWAISETLGLDFTVSRQSGPETAPTVHTVGIGLGWYGVKLW